MWITRFRHALVAPVNLVLGANALMFSAITWNPLAVVLYALGEPIWLYIAMTDRPQPGRPTLELLERQFHALVRETPCGAWIRAKKLPDYPATFARLVETRVHSARIVGAHDDVAALLQEDIVARMDDMLRAYLMLAKERLLFCCLLAKIYPQLVEVESPRSLLARCVRVLVAQTPRNNNRWSDDTPFVAVDDVLREVNMKIASFEAERARQPDHAEIYDPILAVLATRREELGRRAHSDRQMAAQLKVFPDQFEIILSRLAMPSSDHGEVIGAMTSLLEQTEDAVSFAEEIRALA